MDADRSNDTVEHAEVSMFGAAASPRKSPQQIKESLLTAKELYKAEKERYRREREARRAERRRVRNQSGESSQPMTSEDDKSPATEKNGENKQTAEPALLDSTTQIISAARGPFPQLEMYSIPPPRRAHTMHGTGYRNMTSAPQPSAVDIITGRLNDMGFTQELYPSITTRINARVSRHGDLSKETEDSVVTDILEDLLQLSPARPPQPSGSGTVPEEGSMPGALV